MRTDASPINVGDNYRLVIWCQEFVATRQRGRRLDAVGITAAPLVLEVRDGRVEAWGTPNFVRQGARKCPRKIFVIS